MLDRRRMLLTLSAALTAAKAGAHQGHGAAAASATHAGTSRLERAYQMPSAPLLDQTGTRVDLAGELRREGPVLMNFIFTTCPGICPILSAVFAETAGLLRPELGRTRLWSISIDPSYDTPERLRDYAAAFEAPPQWRFFTGEKPAIDAVRRAFEADSDNKMAHRAVYLLRLGGERWLRLEGDVTAEMLAAEVRRASVQG